jgi:hypothetical protein
LNELESKLSAINKISGNYKFTQYQHLTLTSTIRGETSFVTKAEVKKVSPPNSLENMNLTIQNSKRGVTLSHGTESQEFSGFKLMDLSKRGELLASLLGIEPRANLTARRGVSSLGNGIYEDRIVTVTEVTDGTKLEEEWKLTYDFNNPKVLKQVQLWINGELASELN